MCSKRVWCTVGNAHAVLTLMVAGQLFAATYQVTQIAADDVLNLRAAPSSAEKVLARIPANAKDLEGTGATKKVKSQTWVELRWQGKVGWVNKRYLTSGAGDKPSTADKTTDGKDNKAPTDTKPLEDDATLVKARQSGMWILDCAGRSPSWQVDVLPEWLSANIDGVKTGLKIISKHQEHGSYNRVALKTELRGTNRWSQLALKLRYTKSCRSVSGRLVAFSVEGSFNKYQLSGCCRALKVK